MSYRLYTEYWGLIPWSYILLDLMGFIVVLIKHVCLMSIFALLDLIYGVILYWHDLIDSILVPIFTIVSVPLVCLYVTILVEHQRNPVVQYGPVETIPSPEQSTYSSTISQSFQ